MTLLQSPQQPGPEVIKHFSCSTQLSMKFFLSINVKMPTIVGILAFMSGKNSILGLPEPKTAEFLDMFHTYEHLKFHAPRKQIALFISQQLLWSLIHQGKGQHAFKSIYQNNEDINTV